MKKIITMILLFSCTAFCYSQEESEFSFFSLGSSAGIYYNTIVGGFNLYNFGIGISIDTYVNFNKMIGLGIDAGLQLSLEDPHTGFGYEVLRARLLVSIRSFGIIIQPLWGIWILGVNGSTAGRGGLEMNHHLGARIGFGGGAFIFLEYSYIFGDSNFSSIGLGSRIKVLKF